MIRRDDINAGRRWVIGLMLVAGIAGIAGIAGTGGHLIDARQSETPGLTPTPATPIAGGLPVTPDPAECQVDPVPFANLPLVAAPGSASTPPAGSPPTGGSPASPEQVAAAVATLRLQIACVNAGDIPRALALVGGSYGGQLFAQVGAPTEGEYATLATPLPRLPEGQITIVDVGGVAVLPDGTLTARVVTQAGATTVNLVSFTPSPSSPTGYVVTAQDLESRVDPTETPVA